MHSPLNTENRKHTSSLFVSPHLCSPQLQWRISDFQTPINSSFNLGWLLGWCSLKEIICLSSTLKACMGREGKARKIRGGDTHIVMSMTSMALNTKREFFHRTLPICDILWYSGNSLWLCCTRSLRPITDRALSTPSPGQVLPHAPVHGQEPKETFQRLGWRPWDGLVLLPSTLLLKVCLKSQVLVRQEMSVPKAPKVFGSMTGHEGYTPEKLWFLESLQLGHFCVVSMWARRAYSMVVEEQ